MPGGSAGFSTKIGHPKLGVGREDPHALGLFAGDVQRGDRDVRLPRDVEVDHRGVVHLVDVVAGEDEHEVGLAALDEGEVLRDRVGRALVPVGVGAAPVGLIDLDAAREAAVEIPGPSRPDVLEQRVRAVLGHDHHVHDPRVDAVGESEIDDAVLAGERNRGLGAPVGQDAEARPFSAGEDHRAGLQERSNPLRRGALAPDRRERNKRPRTASTKSPAAFPAFEAPSIGGF